MSADVTPAVAMDSLVWEGSGCHETVAMYPSPAIDRDEVLVLLVYECDKMKIGGTTYSEVAVSEISRTDSCALGATCSAPVKSRLLRQTANNHALVQGLRSLGLGASFFGQIQYNDSAVGVSAAVEVPSLGKYSIGVSGGAPGAPDGKVPADGLSGASYTYEGHRGTVELSYTNYSQTAGGALVTVDTKGDAQLAGWLGSTTATTEGFVTQGHWTGTAVIRHPAAASAAAG